jgi:hypothetical protein
MLANGNTPGTTDRASQVLNERNGDHALNEQLRVENNQLL